jgi:predicted nucleic acid-binding protein
LSGLVVDASVGLKWYLDETRASVARRSLNGRDERSVPHLFFTEIGNVLWRLYRDRQRALAALAKKAAVRGG